MKLGLGLCSLLICVVLLEIASRLFLDAPTSVSVNPTDPATASDQEGIIAFGLPDEDVYIDTPTGVRLKRNIRAIVKNHNLSKRDIELTTNSLGYRAPELAPKTEHDFRILVLGDSITLGDYVAYEQTYPFVIEKYLQQHLSGVLQDKNIQVINAGIGAIGLHTELAVLTETGLSLQPDLVLVALYLNDAVESPHIQATRFPAPLNRSYLLAAVAERIDVIRAAAVNKRAERAVESSRLLFETENPLANVHWRKVDWVHAEAGFNRLIYAAFHDWGYGWSEQFWQETRTVFVKLQTLSRSHAFKLVVTLFPVRYQVQSRLLKIEPQQFFEKTMDELNITHFDLLPELRQKYQADRKSIFYDHCHYRPEGNEYIGKVIARFLLEGVF